MLNIPAGWKPIESAPKDGTDILLTNGVHVSCGHWHYDEGGTTEHRDLDGRYIGQDDRDGFAGWLDWMGGMTPNPTHWMPLPAAPGSTASGAPGDAQDERQDWMTCESRRPWVSNGLKAYAQELRDKERRCRTAYNKDFYGIPARYVADAYAEAAAVFESKLAAIAQQKGEA